MKKTAKHIVSLFTILFFGFLGTGCIASIDAPLFNITSGLGIGVILSAFFLMISLFIYVRIIKKEKAIIHNKRS